MSGWFAISDEVAKAIIEKYIRDKHGFTEREYKITVNREENNKLFRVEVGPTEELII